MRSTSPSCPASAVWAWRGQLVSGVFTFLFCKVKRLVVINIPHPSPRPFSLIPCLVFLGVVMSIIAHESVEKRPLHFQDICRCHWKTHAIPKRVLVVFFFFFNRMIYDIFYWSEDCQSYWWVSFDWRKIMFKRCRFVPSVLVVEMEILKAFSCVVTCEFFHSSKYNVQKKALCNMK